LDKIRVPSKYPGKPYYREKKKDNFQANRWEKTHSDVWEIIVNDWEK
jgi:hypothetical protein